MYEFGNILFICYICILYCLAAYLINKAKNLNQPKKESLLQRIKYRNIEIQAKIKTSDIEKQFKAARYPWGLTAKRLLIFRIITFILLMGFSIPNIQAALKVNDIISVLFFLVLPFLAVLFVLNPKRYVVQSFLRYFIGKIKYKMNQEIFLLYSMISDALKETINGTSSGTDNIKSLLRRLKDYTVLIRPAINSGLRINGIDQMMKTIGEEIGTEEAIEVCGIIASLELSNTETIHQLIKIREAKYISSLRENRNKRRKVTGYIMTTLVFLPLIFYIADIFMVIMQVVKSMNSNLNHLS